MAGKLIVIDIRTWKDRCPSFLFKMTIVSPKIASKANIWTLSLVCIRRKEVITVRPIKVHYGDLLKNLLIQFIYFHEATPSIIYALPSTEEQEHPRV